ncbi:hypothetical protein [Sporosarcina sp. P2]|nr:hypothetical protein [Sporosarcina sp. P2]
MNENQAVIKKEGESELLNAAFLVVLMNIRTAKEFGYLGGDTIVQRLR